MNEREVLKKKRNEKLLKHYANEILVTEMLYSSNLDILYVKKNVLQHTA